MKKKWLLLLIIAFPSAFWIILELSTINSKKLPFYGPKSASGKDTVYYKVNDEFFMWDGGRRGLPSKIKPNDFPVFCLIILNDKYKKDGYRLEGILEYTQYKHENLKEIPIFVIAPCEDSTEYSRMFDVKKNKDIYFRCWPESSYDSLTYSYFKEKPVYIDFSFLMLVDRDRHVRGYYDTRYAAEVKRLLGEYKHLRLKEERKDLLEENKIMRPQDTLKP